MEIGELGNTLAADVLKFWMDSENRMLINHQVNNIKSHIHKSTDFNSYIFTGNECTLESGFHRCETMFN